MLHYAYHHSCPFHIVFNLIAYRFWTRILMSLLHHHHTYIRYSFLEGSYDPLMDFENVLLILNSILPQPHPLNRPTCIREPSNDRVKKEVYLSLLKELPVSLQTQRVGNLEEIVLVQNL